MERSRKFIIHTTTPQIAPAMAAILSTMMMMYILMMNQMMVDLMNTMDMMEVIIIVSEDTKGKSHQ